MARIVGEDESLCERCGYPIGALDPDGACPECGLALEASSPLRRVGSAWQRRPSGRAWLETMREAVWTRSAYKVLRCDGHRSTGLLVWNLIISSCLYAVPLAMIAAGSGARNLSGFGTLDSVLTVGVAASAISIGMFVLLWLSTRIEWSGIRFFGRRRGCRVTRGVATDVCSHASYGWVLGGVFGAVTWIGVIVLYWGIELVGVAPDLGANRWLVGAVAGPIGLVHGLLVFEILTYL